MKSNIYHMEINKNHSRIFPGIIIFLLFFSGCTTTTLYQSNNSPKSNEYFIYGNRTTNPVFTYRVAITEEGREAFNKVMLLNDFQDYSNAVQEMEKVILFEENSICAWEQLGRLYFLTGRYNDALEAFQNGLKLIKNDIYLKMAFQRWLKIVDNKDVYPWHELLINQLYPGNMQYIIENRIRPYSESLWDTFHIYNAGTRYAIVLPRSLSFNVLEYGYNLPEILVMGSSLCREGFRPDKLWSVLQNNNINIGPPINFGRSNAGPVFWASLAEEVDQILNKSGRKLKITIILVDPWSLAADYWTEIPPQKAISYEPWRDFKFNRRDYLELWPYWRRSKDFGEWSIPSDWKDLAENSKNYLYATSEHENYIYPGDDPKNITAFRNALQKLKTISDIVITVCAPLPSHQQEIFKNNSAFPGLQAICQEEYIPFYNLSLSNWGLDVRHFFGAKHNELTSIDFHLNYMGSYVFSEKLGELVLNEIKKNNLFTE